MHIWDATASARRSRGAVSAGAVGRHPWRARASPPVDRPTQGWDQGRVYVHAPQRRLGETRVHAVHLTAAGPHARPDPPRAGAHQHPGSDDQLKPPSGRRVSRGIADDEVAMLSIPLEGLTKELPMAGDNRVVVARRPLRRRPDARHLRLVPGLPSGRLATRHGVSCAAAESGGDGDNRDSERSRTRGRGGGDNVK